MKWAEWKHTKLLLPHSTACFSSTWLTCSEPFLLVVLLVVDRTQDLEQPGLSRSLFSCCLQPRLKQNVCCHNQPQSFLPCPLVPVFVSRWRFHASSPWRAELRTHLHGGGAICSGKQCRGKSVKLTVDWEMQFSVVRSAWSHQMVNASVLSHLACCQKTFFAFHVSLNTVCIKREMT